MKALLYRNIVILVYVLLLPLVGWGQNYTVSTIAGGFFHDGPALEAKFRSPNSASMDVHGNIFIADKDNHRIRKISSNGIVSTISGTGTAGFLNGNTNTAKFNRPTGIAVDPFGNVFVADYFNHRIRKIDTEGNVVTYAGSGSLGFLDGPARLASFSYPKDLTLDLNGNLYVADYGNHSIRKITRNGVVSTLGGNGTAGFRNGIGNQALFNNPSDLVVDRNNNVYVADAGNRRIRKIDSSGLVTTFAGVGTFGFTDGNAVTALFGNPVSVELDSAMNIYVVDDQRIRKVTESGIVSTIAGSVNAGLTNGIGNEARFNHPSNILVDSLGNLFVTEIGNNCVRKIDLSGYVSVYAGNRYIETNGIGTAANLYPYGITVDSLQNLYITDYYNHRIKKINSSFAIASIAGSGSQGYYNDTGLTASFSYPSGIARNRNGDLFIADLFNNRIRKIDSNRLVTDFAGTGERAFLNGVGVSASFDSPYSIAIDNNSNIYVADYWNHRIRKISSAGLVTTLAGSGVTSYDGGGFANGNGNVARFRNPSGIAVDINGVVYVADQENNRIRKISSTGIVTTLAGSGVIGSIDGVGTLASFYRPSGVAVDINGNVFVADYFNDKIRKITPNGVVTTIAGSDSSGSGDGNGLDASFFRPANLTVDNQGKIYVTDFGNASVRVLTPSCVTPNRPEILGNNWFCIGSSVLLTASTSNGHIWSTGDTTRSITVSQAGNYTVRAISGSCTSAVSDTFRVIVSQPTSSIITQSICQGNSYQFAGISRTNTGIYIDTLANSVGCDSIVTLNLTVISLATATISGDTAFCQGSFSRLTSSSLTGNLWSTGDTTQFINISQAGSYSVRVIRGGCTSAVSAPFRVVNAGPSPTVINFDTTSNRCLGARLQLTPARMFAHYYWNTGERTRSIYTRTSGQYSVQVANSDSCFGLPSPPIFIAFDTNWCSVEIFRIGLDSITANVWADYYIWYLDGIELLSSNTLKTIPIQGDGVYTFRAVSGGRTSPLSNPIVITSARKSLVTKFEVYPNPATNKVTVNTSGAGTLEILNTLGQVVITQPATATNELNISHLAKGVYTVRFNGASKMLMVK